MKKFIKIIVILVVLLVLLFSLGAYFDIGVANKNFKRISKCKSFSMKADSQSHKDIKEIVSTLANTSTFGLAFKSGHLKKLGKDIDKSVPSPLAFLAIIFSDQKMANEMKKVQQSSFKYNNFCEGLYKNMMISYRNKQCFKKQITGFSKELKLNAERTYSVAETCGRHGEDGDKDAFRPFVDYLIEEKAK